MTTEKVEDDACEDVRYGICLSCQSIHQVPGNITGAFQCQNPDHGKEVAVAFETSHLFRETGKLSGNKIAYEKMVKVMEVLQDGISKIRNQQDAAAVSTSDGIHD